MDYRFQSRAVAKSSAIRRRKFEAADKLRRKFSEEDLASEGLRLQGEIAAFLAALHAKPPDTEQAP